MMAQHRDSGLITIPSAVDPAAVKMAERRGLPAADLFKALDSVEEFARFAQSVPAPTRDDHGRTRPRSLRVDRINGRRPASPV